MKPRVFIALAFVVAQCHCVVVQYESETVPAARLKCNIPVLMIPPTEGEQSSYAFNLSFSLPAKVDTDSETRYMSVDVYQSNGKNKVPKDDCPQVPADILETYTLRLAQLEDGFTGSFNVTESGYYILVISNNFDTALEYSGTAIWQNPFGHLSGDIYGFLPFYRAMAIGLFVISIVWVALNVAYRKDLLRLQHYLTATLVVCLIEFTSWFSYYSQFNEDGMPNTSGLAWALMVTVFRRTVSRMLVVAVSLGLGVVRPNLSRWDNIKIGFAGFVYFLAEFVDEMVLHWAHLNQVDTYTRMLLVLPPTILDAMFYWWIFTALSHTLDSLQEANQFSKLGTYKNFSRVLAGSLFLATLMAVYTMLWVAFGVQNPWMWTQRWFIENGFWQSLYVLVLVCALVLWRPMPHQKDVAGRFQLPTNEDEELELNDDEDYTEDQLEAEISGADMFSIDGDEDPESAGHTTSDRTIMTM